MFATLAACSFLAACGQQSVYEITVPVDLSEEETAALEAEVIKWDTIIEQAPALKKLVAEAQESGTEEELPDEAGFYETTDLSDLRPDPDFFVEKARVLEQLGRIGEAIKTYDDLFAIYDNSSVGWNNRGRLYEKIGDYAEAVENYKKLIDVFSLSQYRLDIAKAWEKAGEIEKAKTAYELWQKETGGQDSGLEKKLGLQ